tara:strand:+ start:52 stop:282 length:231 start_codon:yes stop_codon:yes gene_type:complete
MVTMSKTKRLEKDIAYCIDILDLSNNEIGDILRACERLGNISVEYFCEEFIFECEDEDELDRLHDDNYLTINWGLS